MQVRHPVQIPAQHSNTMHSSLLFCLELSKLSQTAMTLGDIALMNTVCTRKSVRQLQDIQIKFSKGHSVSSTFSQTTSTVFKSVDLSSGYFFNPKPAISRYKLFDTRPIFKSTSLDTRRMLEKARPWISWNRPSRKWIISSYFVYSQWLFLLQVN